MSDVALISSFIGLPRDDAALEASFTALTEALKAEEFHNNGIKAFGVFRDPTFGKWWTYTHFTEEGFKNHAQSSPVQDAKANLRKFLLEDPETTELEPLITLGVGEPIAQSPGRPPEADPAKDVAVVFHFTVNPEDDHKIPGIMREIFDIMIDEEISTGNVFSYSIYRNKNHSGHWSMFQKYTAKGSADHATSERIFAPGWKQVELLNRPSFRVIVKPVFEFGLGTAFSY